MEFMLDNAMDVRLVFITLLWFEDGKCPYRVWRVVDDAEVLP